MCRFVVYAGLHPLMLADLVVRPSHSITKQSFDSRMLLNRSNLNGDGFGVGWYKGASFAACGGESPCVFTSATPAWNSANLRRIAEKISSPLIFAHVRAATPGFPVGETECHPFQYGPFMWMHNGNLAHFAKIKRKIQQSLSDEIYNAIHGGTDSEHCFATFLNAIEDPLSPRERSVDELRGHMLATIRKLAAWSAEAGAKEPGGCQPSLLNFAMTDGRTVVVTRFATNGSRPASLYYASGTQKKNLLCCIRPGRRAEALPLAAGLPRRLGRMWGRVCQPIRWPAAAPIGDSVRVHRRRLPSRAGGQAAAAGYDRVRAADGGRDRLAARSHQPHARHHALSERPPLPIDIDL